MEVKKEIKVEDGTESDSAGNLALAPSHRSPDSMAVSRLQQTVSNQATCSADLKARNPPTFICVAKCTVSCVFGDGIADSFLVLPHSPAPIHGRGWL